MAALRLVDVAGGGAGQLLGRRACLGRTDLLASPAKRPCGLLGALDRAQLDFRGVEGCVRAGR